MIEPEWLLTEFILAIQQQQISEYGGVAGLRDRSLLESALSKPQQQFSYSPASTIFDLAASYAYALSQNHPFVDGNKRIALMSAAVFLDMNGFELDATEAETVIVFRSLANGDLSETELAEWLEINSAPLEH